VSKPLAIDLYCGLGGWTEGLLAEGYDVVGFDIEHHVYGDHRYPAQLVLQDVRTLHGSQFKNAALIVASPPCQAYSYRAMPWKRAKALPPPDNTLFNECFRIQREACEAAGHHIPLVVENVRGAEKWVGRARGNFGSFYLWGDVPALMPMVKRLKNDSLGGGSWFAIGGPHQKVIGNNPDGRKQSIGSWSDFSKVGYIPFGFNREAEKAIERMNADGRKQGGDWFNNSEPSISRRTGSKSSKRKAASALIAKIPLVLARHVGRVWYPAPTSGHREGER